MCPKSPYTWIRKKKLEIPSNFRVICKWLKLYITWLKLYICTLYYHITLAHTCMSYFHGGSQNWNGVRSSDGSSWIFVAGCKVSEASPLRSWSASEVRVSVPIELRQGSGAQPPENFWDIIPSRVPFYNRIHFFTPVFKILTVVLYIELLRVLSRNNA